MNFQKRANFLITTLYIEITLIIYVLEITAGMVGR